MSSKLSGRISRSSDCIAVELEDVEGAAAGEQVVGVLSVRFSLTSSRSMASLPLMTMLRSASSITVRLRRPRKSIFSRPSVSQVAVELRDDGAVGLARMIGTLSIRGNRPMMTPAAHAPLPLEALELAGLVDDLGRTWSGLVPGPELRGLLVALVRGIEDPLERDVLAHDAGRHQLGQLVAHRVRPSTRAASLIAALALIVP